MKKIIFVLLSVLSLFSLHAQRNITLSTLRTPFSYRVNPAIMPESKFFISLIPLLGTQNFQVTNRIASINEALVPDPNRGDSLVINSSDDFFKGMGKKTYIGVDMTNQIFAFGFKVKKNYFTFDVSHRLIAEVGLGSDLLKFLVQGNGGTLIGSRASFDGLGASLTSYIEYGLGYTREINEKLSVGGRVKLLSGLANLQGTDTKIGIATSAADYGLTIDGQANVQSSNTAIYADSSYSKTMDQMRLIKMAYDFSNLGMGVDFGGTYKLTDEVTLKASVIDLGFIKWTQGVANYDLKPFSYRFTGINLNEIIKNDTNNKSTNIIDSLSSIFKTGKNTNSYTTGLPTRIYVGGDYNWNKYLSSGIMMYNEFYNSNYRAGLIISSTLSVRHYFGLTLNYGMYAGSNSNVGVGLRFRGFYILTDNLMSVINYQSARAASVAFGLNLTIGNTNKAKKVEKTEEVEKK